MSNIILYGTNNTLIVNPSTSSATYQPNIIKGDTIKFDSASNLPDYFTFNSKNGNISQNSLIPIPNDFDTATFSVKFSVNGGSAQTIQVTLNVGIFYGYTTYNALAILNPNTTFNPTMSSDIADTFTWSMTKVSGSEDYLTIDSGTGVISVKNGITPEQLLKMGIIEYTVSANNSTGEYSDMTSTVYAQYSITFDSFDLKFNNGTTTFNDGYVPLSPTGTGQVFTPSVTIWRSGEKVNATLLLAEDLPSFLTTNSDGTIQQIKPIPTSGFSSRTVLMIFEYKNKIYPANAYIELVTTDKVATKLLFVAPFPNSTTLGNLVWRLTMSYLIDSIPGYYTPPKDWGDPITYQSEFFPDFEKLPYVEAPFRLLMGNNNPIPQNFPSGVTSTFTQISPLFNFANAVLYQTFFYQTTKTAKNLNSTNINNDVNTYNSNQYTPNLVPLYIYIFQTYFDEFTNMISWLDNPATQVPEVLSSYKSKIVGHLKDLDATSWPDKNWDIFHSYIMLGALGMSITDITSFITSNIAPAINLDSAVDASGWLTNYRNWIDDNYVTIDSNSFTQAGKNFDSDYIHHYTKTIKEAGSGWDPGTTTEKPAEDTITEAFAQSYTKAESNSNYINQGGSCFSSDTIVATAPNTGAVSIPISNMGNTDQVIGSSGVRDVAAIAMPLRGNRTMYSFHNETFQFTESHPFINYDTSPGAPKYLCINPERLLQLMPTYRDLGVGKLKVGATICTYHLNGKIRDQKTIEHNIQQFPAQEGDDTQTLYDVILAHDGSDDYAYYVGSSAGSLVYQVNSEIPAVGRYQYAAIALLNMLDIAAPAILQLSQALTAQQYQKLLENAAETTEEDAEVLAQILYDEQLGTLLDSKVTQNMSTAVKSAVAYYEQMLQQEENAGDFSTLTDPKVLQDQINTFMSYLNQNTGTLDYNWALGMTFERLVANHAQELSNCIYLGWRVFPQPNQYYDYLAVTVSEIYLDANYPIEAPANPAQVNILLTNQNQTLLKVINAAGLRDNTTFAIPIDEVAYFECANMNADPRVDQHRLSFTFSFSIINSSQQNLKASMPLPLPFAYYYRRYELKIYDESNAICGTLSIDTRWLSKADKILEDQNSDKWTNEDRTGFAVTLGQAWGDVLGSLVENAITS